MFARLDIKSEFRCECVWHDANGIPHQVSYFADDLVVCKEIDVNDCVVPARRPLPPQGGVTAGWLDARGKLP